MTEAKVRALLLFSGGLDSILAAKILRQQNVEVEGICFTSNFFACGKAGEEARKIGLKLHTVNISEQILDLVKKPPHGHGKNLNPCIDCHGLMIRMAGEFLKGKKNKQGFDFLASGEVLGQRPFSQNSQTLEIVRKIGKAPILRPLTAKNLNPTEIEEKGLVKREELGKISGRGREEQIKLAKKLGIKDYPSPAGGCLLTDGQFCLRLKEMIDNWPGCSAEDVELLKFGRIFWLNQKKNKILVVVGREEKDNKNLEKLAKRGDIMLELKEETGPLTLIRGLSNFPAFVWRSISRPFSDCICSDFSQKIPNDFKKESLKLEEDKTEKEIMEIAGILTGWYSPKARGKEVILEVKKVNN